MPSDRCAGRDTEESPAPLDTEAVGRDACRARTIVREVERRRSATGRPAP